MNAMKNLRIGTRLGAAFALVALLMIAMALNGWLGLRAVHNNMEDVLKDRYVKVKVAVSTLRTIRKNGLDATAKKYGVDLSKF